MGSEEDRVRLRLHWGGTFQPVGPPHQYQWRYVGGEVFNASVPANSHYADLCLKLNDTVGYTTSVKYQAPGEELVPDELVSITGEDDLQELYDEYRNAMRRPGKPFRVKMFLFPALQTELETDPRYVDAHAQPFDPNEWCIGEEQADDEVTLGDDATLSGLLSDIADKEDVWRAEDMEEGPSSTDPSCAHSEMQWEQPPHFGMMPGGGGAALQAQHALLHGAWLGGGGGGVGDGGAGVYAGEEGDDEATGGVGGGHHTSGGGGDGVGDGLFGAGQPHATTGYQGAGPAQQQQRQQQQQQQQQQQRLFQGLDQFAFGNLLQSISKSAVLQRPTGITEEMDLLDPYHEPDEAGGLGRYAGGPMVHAHLPQQLQQGMGAGAGAGKGTEAAEGSDHMTALVRLQGEHQGLKGVSGNRYGSLVGNLPSHISIFGSDGGQGGRALSAAGDGHATGGGEEDEDSGANAVRGPDGAKWGGVQLPSHISVFGSSARDEDEATELLPELAAARKGRGTPGDMGAGGQGDSKCLTQEFSRDGSLVGRPGDLPLGTPLGGNTPDIVGAGARKTAAGARGRGGAAGAAGAAGVPPLLKLDAGGGVAGEAAGAGAAGCDSPPASTPKLLEEVVQVPLSDVQIIRKIGEGAFGEVSLANVSSHGLVAIKWLKKDRFAKYSESFMREAEVLAKLNHPNIIRMYGVVIEPVEAGHSHASGSTMVDSSSCAVTRTGSGLPGNPQPQCIIAGIMTDYVRGGSLSGQLRAAKRRPTLKERCQVAVQAARGMAFLHAQNPAVIHFDLKPDNLLVDGDGETLHVKVADFGLSKHKFQTFVSCRDLRGTLPYMAPELVSNPNQVSERCDVWSMGVVMWEMYTLQAPYSELSAQQILMALMHGNIHLHVPSSCEPEWRSLIEMCMDPKPETRPSFRQLTIILDKMLRQLS